MTIPSRFDRRGQRKVRNSYPLSVFTGLNDDSNNTALLDSDLGIASNIMLYRADLIGARFGSHRDPYAAALNSGGPITGLFDYRATKNTIQRPIVIAGSKIYEEDSSADPSTATDITNAMAIVATANALWSSAVFKDTLILTQRGGTAGTHVPIKIGPTGNAAVLSGWYANGRTAEFVHAQFGHIFFAGFNRSGSPTVPQNSMNVAYSELQDAEQGWNDTGFVERIGGLSAYGDEYVTGMFRHRDFLMIGTNKRIYPVSYTGNSLALFAIQRPLDVGLASQHAVCSINGEFTFFMDPQGNIHAVHELAQRFGAVGVQSVSRKIRNYVSGFSKSMIQYVVGKYWPQRGWCVWSVPVGAGATAKNELLVLDVNDFPLDQPDHRVATFFRWPGIAANVLEIMERSTESVENASEPAAHGVESLYFGTTTGWSKRFSEEISYDENDAGTAVPIVSELATKYFDFAQPDTQKSIVEIQWHMEPAQKIAGPEAYIDYDFGAYRTRSAVIDMNSNLASADLLGSSFVLGVSRMGSAARVTTSKDFFRGAGQNARVHMRRSMNDDDQWKMQQAVLLVEQRGEVPETSGTSESA